MTDRDLLREYVATRDEQAFAELSSRYVDMVYSSALRQLRDKSSAEDATQQVFIQLCKRANTILKGEALAGWLLATTRAVALNILRSEARRFKREREAAAMRDERGSEGTTWESITPILDEAVASLKYEDRDAITLRFLNQQSLRDVATALEISESAAQKRVSRALDKLQLFFARRGITATSETLLALLAANVLTVSSFALKAKIAGTAVEVGKISAGSTVGFSKGATFFMALGKTKLTVVAICALAIAAVPTTVVVHRVNLRSRLNGAYALVPGENVRFVRQPYIPERAELHMAGGPEQIEPQQTLVIAWDGQKFEFRRGNSAAYTLADVLRNIAGIAPQDTTIPRELLKKALPGDWVIRADATEAEKIADLARIISEVIDRPVKLVREPRERDTIVARGKFRYSPFANARDSDRAFAIRLYVGANPNQRVTGAMIWQNQSEMLQALGEVIATPLVNESQLPDGPSKAAIFETTDSGDLKRPDPAPSSAAVDSLLANVAKQTGLSFTRERRVLPTWKLVGLGN
jgi:RNA polymerase sigma factor (sigma-70 family)